MRSAMEACACMEPWSLPWPVGSPRALHVCDALLQGAVARRHRLRLIGELRVRVGVAERLLQVLQVLRYGGVVLVQALQALEVLGHRAVRRVALRVGGLQRLDLPPVLDGGVAQQLLDVVHALGDGRGVRAGRLDAGQGPEVHDLRVLERLQLLGLLVRRVAEHLFEIIDALRQRGVIAVRGR